MQFRTYIISSRMHSLFSLVALASIFIMLGGPAINHHFADMLPSHTHIFAEHDLEHEHINGSHIHTDDSEHTTANIVSLEWFGIFSLIAILVYTAAIAFVQPEALRIEFPTDTRKPKEVDFEPPVAPPKLSPVH